MKLQLGGGDANLSGEERDVAAHYEQQLGELCSCLRSQWEQYLENLDQRHVFTAYQAQVVPASGRGDLISQEISFDPTNEQHLYALHDVFTARINAGLERGGITTVFAQNITYPLASYLLQDYSAYRDLAWQLLIFLKQYIMNMV